MHIYIPTTQIIVSSQVIVSRFVKPVSRRMALRAMGPQIPASVANDAGLDRLEIAAAEVAAFLLLATATIDARPDRRIFFCKSSGAPP